MHTRSVRLCTQAVVVTVKMPKMNRRLYSQRSRLSELKAELPNPCSGEQFWPAAKPKAGVSARTGNLLCPRANCGRGQSSPRRFGFSALLVFASGCSALVFQVAWMRELRLVFGATTAAVAAVLAIFMAGLGVGSAVLGKRADRVRDPLRYYGGARTGHRAQRSSKPMARGSSPSDLLSTGWTGIVRGYRRHVCPADACWGRHGGADVSYGWHLAGSRAFGYADSRRKSADFRSSLWR